jgi:hypothetical protein
MSDKHLATVCAAAATLLLGHAGVAFALIGGQSADPAAATRELTEIEGRLAMAYQSGDCDAWGSLLAPGWSVVHITGAETTSSCAPSATRRW